MRYRPFGSGRRPVSVIGQGTWNLEMAGERAVAALRRGIDLGLSHIDTAESYGDGRAERIVARAIRGRRSEVFLVSKVLPRNATRGGTVEACHSSLRRLETDYIDCLLLHWVGPHPLEETVAGFEELRERELIRSWGVSNFPDDKLAEVLRVAGRGGVACNQVLYHLEERSVEHVVLPYCLARMVSVVGYSALGSGRFPSTRSGSGLALARIAERRQVTPRQVALAFLLRNVPFLLVKSAQLEHVEENAAAAELELSEEESLELEAAFPRGPKRFGVPKLGVPVR